MALVFFYANSGEAYLLESDDSVKKQVDDLNFLTSIICRMMYVLHENKAPSDSDEQSIVKYCIPVSKEVLYQQKSLFDLIGDNKPGKKKPTKNLEESKESYADVAQATKNNDLQIQ